MAKVNDEITEDLINKIISADIKSIKTLFINDLDRGPYISNAMRIDPTETQLDALVEIYRMMRPGEPPAKEAAEFCLIICFFRVTAMICPQ